MFKVVCNFDVLQQNHPSGEACGICFFCKMATETKKDAKKAVFNSEEIEKLIDLWHKEPVLYNCQSGNYRNKDAKAAAVGQIFVALEKEGKLIRTTLTEGGETEVDAKNVFKLSLPLSGPIFFSCCKAKSCTRVNGG